MNCSVCKSRLIEVARGGRLEPVMAVHLNSCGPCSDFLEAQRRLSVATRSVAVLGRAAALPAGLEGELLAEFEAVRRVSPRPRYFWPVAGAFALAAALMGVVVLLRAPERQVVSAPQAVASSAAPASVEAVPVPAPLGLRPVTVPPRPIRPVREAAPGPPEPQEEAFMSIPYTMPLAPEERANVVRMEVPVAALIAAGLTMRVRDMSASASADVLVGEDGRARAVRLVSVSDSNFNRSYK